MPFLQSYKDELLQARAAKVGIELTWVQAGILRRAALTLRRWAEAECGDSNQYASFSIERDEETGVPYRCVYPHDSNKVIRTRIPDREAGALRRVATVAKQLGVAYFHQSDPRGCSLYIGKDIDQQTYTRGLACEV